MLDSNISLTQVFANSLKKKKREASPPRNEKQIPKDQQIKAG